MKKLIGVLLVVFACFCSYAKNFSVSFVCGENWKEKRNPQVAIWVEDEDGNYIKTLFVTNRASKKNWIFCSKEGRPESLPVWYHAVSKGNEKNLDAVTGATLKSDFELSSNVKSDKRYIIKAECNNSFDYNEFFTKKNSGVNGQPSVVYGAIIDESFVGSEELSYLGTGAVDGSDGNIHHENNFKLTTAKSIVKSINITNK